MAGRMNLNVIFVFFREVNKADLLFKIKVLSFFEKSGTTH